MPSRRPLADPAAPGGGCPTRRLHGVRREPLTVATLLLLVLAWTPIPAHAAQPSDVLSALETRATGDLDEMIKKRRIRILVIYNKTFYFVDRGRQRGATYDLGRAFEDDLNRRLKTGNLKVSVVFIPVSRDQLLPGLVKGLGDIAAANLTITDERRQQVDFSDPIYTGVDEIVVTGPASPPIESAQDLAGQEVFVRKSSSYHESLLRLNAELEQAGKRAGPTQARPRDPRGRGPPRDGERGARAVRRRRQPQGRVLGADLPEDPPPSERGRPDRGGDRVGVPEEQPQAPGGAQSLPGRAQEGHVLRQPDLQPLPPQRQVRPELARAGGAREVSAHRRAVPEVRGPLRVRRADAHGPGVPGVPARQPATQPRRRGRGHAGPADDRCRK